jgi:hypothetical protein
MGGEVSKPPRDMKIHVQNDTVRQNIELFRTLVARQSQKVNIKTPLQERTYTLFINRITGEMHFPDLDAEDPPSAGDDFLNAKIWKPIEIHIKEYDEEEGVFDVAEEGTSWRFFRCDDLEPSAYKVLAETVKTLNFVSKKLHLEMEKIIRELTGLEIESLPAVLMGKDIIHEAWHQVDRIGAEMLLRDQIEGTFLFRKDSFACILEEQLKNHFQLHIKCVTLTFLEENGKVTDKTLVAKEGLWLIYDDDPNLVGPSYSSIHHLLEGIQHILKTPLLN